MSDNLKKQASVHQGGTESLVDYINRVIADRAVTHMTETAVGPWFLANNVKDVVLGGGALLHGVPNDYDFWPGSPDNINFLRLVGEGAHRFKEYEVSGLKVQVCRAPAVSPAELAKEFDFAHCQVAVRLQFVGDTWYNDGVAVTQNFLKAMAAQGTFYVPGHRTPLRSLARVSKISKKFNLTEGESRTLTYQVLADIRKRGLENLLVEDNEIAELMG